MNALRAAAAAFAFALLLAGCDDGGDKAQVAAQEPTEDSIGYYCHMNVVEHPGPKGQIFLDGKTEPIWFSSVRDTIAFTMLPEEPKTVAAIFVNDMGKASWDKPEPGTWVEAHAATFVVGSDRAGGMHATEVVPFSAKDAAEAFVAKHGGRLVSFAEIPKDAVLGDAGAAGADPADAPATQ